MNKGKVFITGITGFLGSRFAESFVNDGYEVIGLKRTASDTWRCAGFAKKASWVNADEPNWMNDVIKEKPAVILHAAWEGVSAANRDDLQAQFRNFALLIDVLKIGQAVKARKFVGFGSQAEYGTFDGIVNEEFPANPTNAYGAVKLMSMVTVKYFCEVNHMDWYWLRLFPCFGEKESDEWFIPMLTKNIHNGTSMNMTPGLQQYAYLYAGDEADWIKRLVESNAKSGIYNVSSANLISLKNLVEKILGIIKPIKNNINVGALPYRPHQSMIMGGETSKLSLAIGDLTESNFDQKLKTTVAAILDRQSAQNESLD